MLLNRIRCDISVWGHKNPLPWRITRHLCIKGAKRRAVWLSLVWFGYAFKRGVCVCHTAVLEILRLVLLSVNPICILLFLNLTILFVYRGYVLDAGPATYYPRVPILGPIFILRHLDPFAIIWVVNLTVGFSQPRQLGLVAICRLQCFAGERIELFQKPLPFLAFEVVWSNHFFPLCHDRFRDWC